MIKYEYRDCRFYTLPPHLNLEIMGKKKKNKENGNSEEIQKVYKKRCRTLIFRVTSSCYILILCLKLNLVCSLYHH